MDKHVEDDDVGSTAYWKDIKEATKSQRRLLIQEAQEKLVELTEEFGQMGYIIRWNANGHGLVRNTKNHAVLAQYWPSGQKWQIASGGKIRRGSLDDFIKFIRGGTLK